MARAALGWSQEDLADMAGVSRITISNLEQGNVPDPKTSTMRVLIRAFEQAGLVLTEDGVWLGAPD
jgi:predicted transcriptional regulator